MPTKPAKTKKRSPKPRRVSLLDRLVQEREREILVRFLEQHDGNIAATAKTLEISRRSLEGKMLALGLRDMAGALRGKAGVRGPR